MVGGTGAAMTARAIARADSLESNSLLRITFLRKYF
jgi:hypothetical protein